MKKISEMTLEELQDYAVAQEESIKGLTKEKKDLSDKVTELTGINQNLVKRNNDLFMKVEQQVIDHNQGDQGKKEEVKSCEEVARGLVLGGNL